MTLRDWLSLGIVTLTGLIVGCLYAAGLVALQRGQRVVGLHPVGWLTCVTSGVAVTCVYLYVTAWSGNPTLGGGATLIALAILMPITTWAVLTGPYDEKDRL